MSGLERAATKRMEALSSQGATLPRQGAMGAVAMEKNSP